MAKDVDKLIEALSGKKVPIATLDTKWHKLFAKVEKTKEIKECEENLNEKDFFNDKEKDIYKRGRNNIRHIPKSSDLLTYQIASGFEAIVGYLYLTDNKRLKSLFNILTKEVFIIAPKL